MPPTARMTPTTDTPVLIKSYLLMVAAACFTIGAMGLAAPLLIPEPGPLGLPLTRESAVAALLAGLGLGAHIQRWRALHYAAGTAIFLLIGYSLATQDLHLPGAVTHHRPHNHLSIEAALLLAAIAFCLMIPGESRLARRPWQWVGAVMLFLGGVSALWMLLGSAPWLQFHSTTAWVAILFTLLFGSAMWLVGRQDDRGLDRLGGPAIIAALAGSLLSAGVWYQLSLEHNRDLQANGEAQLEHFEAIGEQVLTDRTETLRRLATRWQLVSRLPTADYVRQRDAQSYLRDIDSLQLLATLDTTTLQPAWQASRGPTGRELLTRILADEQLRAWLARPASDPRLLLLPDTPARGRSTSVVAIPMPIPGRAKQHFLALLDFGKLMTQALGPEHGRHPIQLSVGGAGTIMFNTPEADRQEPLVKLAEKDLALPFGPTVKASSYLDEQHHTGMAALLPAAAALVGLALTQLVVLLLAVIRSRLAHARRLSTIRRELESQHRIQQMILHSKSLEATLLSVCEVLEEQFPQSHCSIMLTDRHGDQLHLVAAPSLPVAYRTVVASVPLTEVGSCGTAACRKEPVFSEDIATDPRWEGFQEIAVENGLRSCWSYPLLSSDGEVLGTFASYRQTAGAPTANHRRQIARAADLISLAIERHRDRAALEENEQRYRSLFTYNPDAVFLLTGDGHLKRFNHATETMFNRPAEAIDHQPLIELVAPDDRARVTRAVERTIRGRTQTSELTVHHGDGSRHDFDVTYLPMVIDGRIEAVYGIAKDITIRKRQERRLRTLERSVEASIHGVVIADARRPDLPIVYTNAAFTDITGYRAEEVLGRNCRFLQGEETDPEAIREVRAALAEQRSVRVLLRNYRKDGSQFWNELHIAPVEDDFGEVSHFVGLQNDVSAHKSYEAQLAYNATHDALTGLANRSLFEDRLRHTAELSRRRQTRVAVLFIDLDEFKPINDSLGHAIGDRILIEVARRLERQMRTEDTLARLGGDEFVALLADIEEDDEALLVAERLLPEISRPYRVDEHELHLSASVGITTSEPDMESPLPLIQQADMAMYRAKQQGRNTCQLFNEEINSQVRQRVGLRNDLQEALERDDFQLFYQPLVVGADRRINGFEALLRWHHPEHGWISPATFIPLAEETGQIIPLSEWVLERACRDMKTLIDQGLDDGRMAINLSPLQFHRPNFLATIRRMLELTALPANRLELELTEGILMSETESAIDILHQLRDSTVSVSIDDFGTGFSSLSYLKHLPIDKLKIDRSFIRGVEESADDAAIVQGIISMAHHLGIRVVAEGIETETQRKILTGWGCDILQGYLFARPMPLDEVRRCLADNRQIVTTPAPG